MSWLEDTFKPLGEVKSAGTREGQNWLGLPERSDNYYAGNFAVAAVEIIKKQEAYIDRLERQLLRLEVGRRP